MEIAVFIQSLDGVANNNSLESLSAAQKIVDTKGGNVHAITFDKNVANSLASIQLSSIIHVSNDELNNYNPLFHIKAMELLCNEIKPDLIIYGHSYQTRDWVPRLSARLDFPFISDCVDFSNDENISFTRPIYQAKLNEKSFDLSSVELTINPGERFKESADGVDLSTAEVIVSIGRGLSKEENIPLAKSLAEKLNAQIGASRPVVDAGWLDHSYQIGSSGQTVSPKLYLAVGISGAIQHLVGMKGSKNIMAINKDPNAPIFEISDYAVVGDIFEILPKLIEQL